MNAAESLFTSSATGLRSCKAVPLTCGSAIDVLTSSNQIEVLKNRYVPFVPTSSEHSNLMAHDGSTWYVLDGYKSLLLLMKTLKKGLMTLGSKSSEKFINARFAICIAD